MDEHVHYIDIANILFKYSLKIFDFSKNMLKYD